MSNELSTVCGQCGSADTASGASGTVWCTQCESIVRSDDASDFARLDAVVAAGKETFLKVGRALAEIRDRKLYRAEYGTFADYLQQRHAMKKTYAYDLIRAAAVDENVRHGGQKLPPVPSERHARELAKVSPDQQADVWRRANVAAEAAGKPVTTAMIAQQAEIVAHTEQLHAAIERRNQHIAIARAGLLEARELVPDHLWVQWLDEALGISVEQAERLMCHRAT